jgi:hypothetical protein
MNMKVFAIPLTAISIGAQAAGGRSVAAESIEALFVSTFRSAAEEGIA